MKETTITREDVLQGRKLIQVESKWGDTFPIIINSIPRRQLQRIITEHPGDADEVLAQVCSELPPDSHQFESLSKALDCLSIDGWASLLEHVQALNLGLNHLKNAKAQAAQMLAPLATPAPASSTTAPSAT